MRTPADCINALNGCVRVGNPKRWTLGVDEEIANDIIANLMEVGRLRAALATIAKHSGVHSDFPHGVEGLQRFAANTLNKQ